MGIIYNEYYALLELVVLRGADAENCAKASAKRGRDGSHDLGVADAEHLVTHAVERGESRDHAENEPLEYIIDFIRNRFHEIFSFMFFISVVMVAKLTEIVSNF